MLTVNQDYRTIFADARHAVEWRITVGGTVYGQNKLVYAAGGGDGRPKLSRSLISGSEPTVGACIAATFSCAIMEASSNIPRMASVIPAYRLVLGNSASDWITLGTFYIDTRSTDKRTGALMLSCYDAMLKADGEGGKSFAEYMADRHNPMEWPISMSYAVSEIAVIMGVDVDSRTVIHSGAGYAVEYPNDYSMREVLGFIAAAHAGNWTITPEGKLRLVPLTGGSGSFSLGAAAVSLKTAPALDAWSGVTVYWADEEAYEAGNDSGRRLTCDCPWATQDTADGILSDLSGAGYQPYSADGAIIDLALELGDVVTVGRTEEAVSGPVFSIEITAGPLEQASIAAPGEDEIDHEYPYASYVDRNLKRRVGLGQAYYGVTIDRLNGIRIARSDGMSEAVFNSDVFAMRALIEGIMQDRIYFDSQRGDYIFKGLLSADAILTPALYADTGDIAELTVDRLSTSRQVRKYILEDTSDDNYIRIQDNVIQLVTASVLSSTALATEDDAALTTEDDEALEAQGDAVVGRVQATNRKNQPLYWQREPVGRTDDGYPLDENGVQIYATTTQSDWPVWIYEYEEFVKAQFSFEELNGVYIPKFILGAGDDNGNSRGYIYKTVDSVLLRFVTSSGENCEISLGNDGYAEIRKLRRAAVMDFSGWSSGYFTETLDGGVGVTYAVEFDAQGRPVKIWDSNHECEVIW